MATTNDIAASQLFDPNHLSDQEQARLNNLNALTEAGIEPYPARTQRTHTIADARLFHENQKEGQDEDAAEPVTVVGRLKRIRVMGKMSFADLEDGTGQIQLVVRRDSLPDGWYNTIWKKHIDLGDFIGATGPLVITKTGELSVDVQDIQFLSKTLKPMPDKWHGVRDQETRYRRRYVDLIANAEVRDLFRTRAAIVRGLREYLDNENFLEVETPILQPIYGGAAARPFVTHHNQLLIASMKLAVTFATKVSASSITQSSPSWNSMKPMPIMKMSCGVQKRWSRMWPSRSQAA